MGMDSYLYRTTLAGKSAHEEFKRKMDAADKVLEDYTDEIINKYPELKDRSKCNRENFERLATKEEIKKMDALADEKYHLENREDDTESDDEICYWRKPWGLHHLICQKMKNLGGNDNCVRVYLSNEDLLCIKKEIDRTFDLIHSKNDVTDDDFLYPRSLKETKWNDYWDIDDLNYLRELTENIISEGDIDNRPVYYYSWY